MNLKRWFAWLCLAVALVAEICLFRAIHEKNRALTEMQTAQGQVWRMQKELENWRHSNAGEQAAEILRLRKQNEIYTNRLAQFQADFAQLAQRATQAEQRLTNARLAIEMQQDHLQQLQTENQLVTDAGLTLIHRNTCINNLRQLDNVKQRWAQDNNMEADDVPTAQDLLPYLTNGVLPACPDGGTYSINAVGTLPACSFQGHVMTQ